MGDTLLLPPLVHLISYDILCNRLFCSAASARPSFLRRAGHLGGRGFNTYARGDKNFYGRGPGYQVDSTQKFTVVTRFVTVDGTDNGDLKEIQRFYIQNGRTTQQPVNYQN
uniref:cellulose 1,4-beta-cellobiosidase (non-reducing end) n=1 Tax=Daphnia galeata TaxID=27404 RepID=A0A8J2S0X0_9CRUS|nr:unnamed protein product [Daphnia galeata]